MKQQRMRLDQRGAISVMVALGTVVFLGAAALAIDLGMLMKVRTESQRAADAAALAGASAFIDAPGTGVTAVAEARAISYAGLNGVHNASPALVPSDVVVDVPNERVTVTVRNDQNRGNAIGLGFAKILGFNTRDVSTVAVAEAWPVGGVNCLLPLFLVDRWDELGGNPTYFDPGIDYYETFDPVHPTATYTGYDDQAIGTQIVIKPAQGQQSPGQPNNSWYYPFDAGDVPGGANYRDAIESCTHPGFTYSVGQQLWVENGAMIGPTAQGFNALINQDPTAAWNPGMKCIVDDVNVTSTNPAHCRGSVRKRPAPMFDPQDSPANGKKQVTITNFAGLFVDRVQGNNVYVIFMGFAGVNPVPPGSVSNPGGLPKAIVLVG